MTNGNSAVFSYAEKKHFKVHGFRFFQESLEILRNEINNFTSLGREKALDASAAAMYVGLFSQCTHAGVIPPNLSISTISKMLNIHRSTGANGFNELLERGLVIEHITNDGTEYEIAGYHDNNKAREDYLSTKKLNYFTVPFELLHTTVLAELVKQRSAKGIILMLEILNSFRHKLKVEKVSPLEFTYELTMDTLKDKLSKKTAKRVRNVLTSLSPIFTFTPVDRKNRIPRVNVITRIHQSINQVRIHKYIIQLAPGCLIEKDATDVQAVKAMKDADYRIKLLGLTMYQKDKIGLRSAYKGNVKEIARHIKQPKLKDLLLRDSMQHALESLESFVLGGHKLKSLGAFVNAKLQEYVFDFIEKNHLTTDLLTIYHNLNAPLPKVFQNYQEHRQLREQLI